VLCEPLHDSWAAAKPCPRSHEDPDRARAHEAVDQILREPAIDLRDPLGGPLEPVTPWVVEVDVEPVLVRDVLRRTGLRAAG
jgi:hypothetical protein